MFEVFVLLILKSYWFSSSYKSTFTIKAKHEHIKYLCTTTLISFAEKWKQKFNLKIKTNFLNKFQRKWSRCFKHFQVNYPSYFFKHEGINDHKIIFSSENKKQKALKDPNQPNPRLKWCMSNFAIKKFSQIFKKES